MERVRATPRQRADMHDLFLVGRRMHRKIVQSTNVTVRYTIHESNGFVLINFASESLRAIFFLTPDEATVNDFNGTDTNLLVLADPASNQSNHFSLFGTQYPDQRKGSDI
jgi:hypothetical protein